MIDYRGFRYEIKPIYEDTESRLARGDWQSKIVGYQIVLWMPNGNGYTRMKGESEEFAEKWQAEQIAEASIDAIVDSL